MRAIDKSLDIAYKRFALEGNQRSLWARIAPGIMLLGGNGSSDETHDQASKCRSTSICGVGMVPRIVMN